MPSAKRSEQARINGAKSTGPITPEGKARSSRNNLRHGRYANHATVLSNEDAAAFEDLASAYLRRIGPVDSIEARLAREIASIDWRLDRNRAMETRMFDHEMDVQAPMLEAACPSHRVPELTRLLKAGDALLKNSRLPSYLATRESALLYARQNALSTLRQLRQSHAPAESCSQIIEPTPLNPDLDHRYEPGSNPSEARMQLVDDRGDVARTPELAPTELGSSAWLPS